jgi:hypothetical protein
VPSHIAGTLNILSDNLSRSLFFQELPHTPDTVPPPATSTEPRWWETMSRAQVCRQLLTQACSAQSAMPSRTILEIVRYLR